MASPRAYELINIGKSELPHPFCPEVLLQCKLHPLVALEYAKGEGFNRIGSKEKGFCYRIDIYWLNPETNEVFTEPTVLYMNREENAKSYIEKMRIKWKNGPPKLKKKLSFDEQLKKLPPKEEVLMMLKEKSIKQLALELDISYDVIGQAYLGWKPKHK